MSAHDINTMIEVLASVIPPRILHDDRAVAEYLVPYCNVGNWQLSVMNAHLPKIIDRACALRVMRAA